MPWSRIFSALVYGLSAAAAAIQATGLPKTPEGWVGLGMAFLIAAWGKYSSSQTFLAPNRPAWTDEQRKQEALALLNKGL